MGLSLRGDWRLTQIAAPTVGVLTNVHGATPKAWGDVAGVARAKVEIVAALDPGAGWFIMPMTAWIPGCLRF